MHTRKQIKAAIFNILKNNTSVGSKVYLNRPNPISENDLPAIFIYSQDETSIEANLSEKKYRRTLNLAIEARSSHSTNVDELLDDLSEEIETLMNSDLTLQGLCTNITLTSSEFDQGTNESRKIIGAIRLNFEIKYIF